MKLLFLLIFFFTQIQAFAGDKSVINFSADKTKVNKKIEVEFENATNLFTLKVEGQTVITFHEMKVDELIDLLNDEYIKDEFHEDSQKVLKTVQLLDAVSDPSDERLITASLLMLEDSIDTINNPPGGNGDCEEHEYFKNRGPGISVDIDPSKEDLSDPILDQVMAEQGFFRMGRLTGMTLDLNTTNDNIGHGLYRALGGERSDAVEGDDRGSTFGADGRAEFEFEKGSIALDISNRGYGRLAPQTRTFSFGGVDYESTTRYYTDEDGNYYQEFLNVQNIELEVKRFLGESDTYVKVTPGVTIRDDQSGLSKSLQEAWHSMSEDYIQYNYIDHIERKTGLNLRLEIGKDFVLEENSNSRTSLDISGGAQASTGDDRDRYLTTDTVLRYERFGSEGSAKRAGFEATLGAGAKLYTDHEVDNYVGIELKKRFRTGDSSYLFIRTGASYLNDRYSRDYGSAEIESSGRLDIQYNYGIGWEIDF